MTNLITIYEKAIAGYLDRNLDRAKVRLWADAFASNQQARGTAQIFFGLQSVSYEGGSYSPDSQKVDRIKRATFEIQALIFNLTDHQAALDLMDDAFKVLSGYQPYAEFQPLQPVRYGSPRRNNPDGSWSYSGEFRSEWWEGAGSLTPIADILEPEIIGVGLRVWDGTKDDRSWGKVVS